MVGKDNEASRSTIYQYTLPAAALHVGTWNKVFPIITGQVVLKGLKTVKLPPIFYTHCG